MKEKETVNEFWSALRDSLETSKTHVEFLARNDKEFASNLQSIAESLQGVINFTRSLQTGINNRLVNLENKRSVECAEKNRLYAYLLGNGELEDYQRFCINNPLQDFQGVTGVDLVKRFG